jgi:putative toxin-antitoxin system antitoxin component (TIGR02293 family)
MLTTDVVPETGGHAMRSTGAASLLGVQRALQGDVASRMFLIDLSRKGVTKGFLLRVARYLGLSVGQMAGLLPVTERTIQRYGRDRRFTAAVSEQILQIATVAARGEDVFGSREAFLGWMRSPSPALGNRTPASLLGSRFGSEIVLDELGRIEHGVIS